MFEIINIVSELLIILSSVVLLAASWVTYIYLLFIVRKLVNLNINISGLITFVTSIGILLVSKLILELCFNKINELTMIWDSLTK